MNHLQRRQRLSNRYYGLRHDRSLANEAELIVSAPEHGVSQYGLSQEGRQQVASAITEAIIKRLLDQTTLIVTSDFARAHESAEIVAYLLGTRQILMTPKLRERYFGRWEWQHSRHYQEVWGADLLDGAHKQHEVESTHQVLARTTSLIQELEEAYAGRTILLVSHGDVLQILQTAFERVDSAQHRQLLPLETGQIRELQLKATLSLL
jgi:probable phosphoglycerate mutase